MKAFITYEGLPIKSGGAHNLSGQSAHTVYASISKFLNTHTNNTIADKIYIELSAFSFKNIIKYSLKYGFPFFDGSNFLANGSKKIYWLGFNKKLDQYVNDVSYNNELNFSVLWKFHFIDVKTSKVLPGQMSLPVLDNRQHNSQLHWRVSSVKSTISAWFAFPFGEFEKENLDYIKGIEDTLPFKFSKSSWRLWKLSKNNNWTSEKLSVED